MRYQVSNGERVYEVLLAPDGARGDGRPVRVSLERGEGTPVVGLLVDDRSQRIVADRTGRGRWKVRMPGGVVDVDVVDERTKAIREMAGSGAAATGPRPILAPMPGLVVKVEVSVGDCVQAGQGVAIVEAMKMENELRASGAGVVTRVHVREGDAVEKDQVLVELDPLEEGGS
jgi:pyruvate carboxylase subunit B